MTCLCHSSYSSLELNIQYLLIKNWKKDPNSQPYTLTDVFQSLTASEKYTKLLRFKEHVF